jgi:putative redox protein
MSRVHATLAAGAANYRVDLKARQHTAVGDEPPALGGGDTGLRPFEFALAGLCSCTAITLRMYAERKQWALGDVEVEARIREEDKAFFVERTVRFGAPLEPAQRERLAEICEKTPVTRLVKQGASLTTTLVD